MTHTHVNKKYDVTSLFLLALTRPIFLCDLSEYFLSRLEIDIKHMLSADAGAQH